MYIFQIIYFMLKLNIDIFRFLIFSNKVKKCNAFSLSPRLSLCPSMQVLTLVNIFKRLKVDIYYLFMAYYEPY